MMIKAADVAELMQVSEATVLKWIRKACLHAVEINGGYQINRVDLLEWATNHGLKVPPSVFSSEGGSQDFPSLFEALQAGGIHRGVPGHDKPTVLENLVGYLKLPPQIDADFLLQVLLAREALGSTGIGDGIAIPHVRNPILVAFPSAAVSLSFLAHPVDFGAIDGKPVHIVFMLTSPTVKVHLHMLSKLAYALQNEAFRSAVRGDGTDSAILDSARDLESKLAK